MMLGDGAVQDMWLLDPLHLDRIPTGVLLRDARRVSMAPACVFTAVELAYFNAHGKALETGHAGGSIGVAPPFWQPGGGAPSPPLVPPIGAPPPAALVGDGPKEAFVLMTAAALAVGDPIDLSKLPQQVLGNRVLYEVA